MLFNQVLGDNQPKQQELLERAPGKVISGRLPMPFSHIENSPDKQLNEERRIIDGFIYIN